MLRIKSRRYNDLQCAIDNAKRAFDIDLTNEIRRIKKDMNLKVNGYPAFWTVIRPGFSKAKVNKDLQCPMNYLYNIKLGVADRVEGDIMSISDFFVDYDPAFTRNTARLNKKVEALIQKYSLQLKDRNKHICETEDTDEENILLEKFDELIEDIRQIVIPKKYKNVMLCLINRAFYINNGAKVQRNRYKSLLNKNRPMLLKTFYDVSPEVLLSCFTKNLERKEKVK